MNRPDSTLSTRVHSFGCRAMLHCGSALYFETVSLAPQPTDEVPCVRHGYCRVLSVEPLSGSRARTQPQRAPLRSHAELVAHLRTAEAFTLAELRRARFSLRMISEAARRRLLMIEEDAETVIIRPLPAARTDRFAEGRS